MKILVTGGSGLVGQALKEEVLGSEHTWIFSNSGICDLREYGQVLLYLGTRKPDYVVHLAANVGGLFKNLEHNVEMYEDNMLMNFNILRACHQLKITNCLCILSTCFFQIKHYIYKRRMLHGPPHDSNSGYSYAKRMLDIHYKLYNDKQL